MLKIKHRKKEVLKMNNYFGNALKNYIKSLPNEKEGYYMDTDTVNFRTLIKFLFTDMNLCNLITQDYEYFTIEIGNDYDEETGESADIFQYYIVNCDNWRIEQYKNWLEENEKESDIILYHDDNLDVDVLGVTHFGTSWDYVPTSIEIERETKENV